MRLSLTKKLFATILLSLAGLVFTAHLAFAQSSMSLPALYRAEVPIDPAAPADRTELFKQGLAQVLVRLSGTRAIMDSPAADAMLARAAKFALGFSYVKAAVKNDDLAEAAQAQQLMRIEFDGPALERALHKAGLPVWSGQRPAVLVWLGLEQGKQRQIIAEDTETTASGLLRELAAERGVPIILPLMDLEDRKRVAFVDIRGGFTENLVPASERYNTSILLVGALRRYKNGQWSVKWTIKRDNTASSWRESGVSLQEAMYSGVDGLADLLASRFAVVTAPDAALNQYLVSVEQLLSFEQYAAVLNMLRNMVFVEDVTPVHIKADQAEFAISMRGQLAELEKALLLSNRLRPVITEQDPNAMTESPAATQSWQRMADLQLYMYR